MGIQIQCSGYAVAADWIKGESTDKILLVLPGYSSTKARQRAHVDAMVELTGTSALVIDYSGHGESPFELRDTRPAQHFLEVIYAFDWLKTHYPDAEISLSGGSYGGFLGVQLTKYHTLTNLILRAPAIYEPSSFYTLWSERIDNEQAYASRLKDYRENSEILAKHPVLARASTFKGRVLVVAHEHDEQVPRQTTNAYIEAFSADTILAEGFSHTIDAAVRDPNRLMDYQWRIAEWLNKTE